MRVIYVAHPLGAGVDREQNRRNAAKWCAWVAELGHAPVADWIILSGEWHESPENRERWLSIDRALIYRCDEVWLVGGRISPGMRYEAEAARLIGKPVYDLTTLYGALPPADVTAQGGGIGTLTRWIP